MSNIDDVPVEHWVYPSLTYFLESGIETRYPKGFFDGSHPRMKIECVFAVGDAISFFEDESRRLNLRDTERISIMLETLRSEFSEQVYVDHYYDQRKFLEEVPPDHWAYEALEWLVDTGYLEGYTATHFSGDSILNRHQFMQAVARLLDTLEFEGCEYREIIILAEALRCEFDKELAEANRRLSELDVELGTNPHQNYWPGMEEFWKHYSTEQSDEPAEVSLED